MKRFCLPVCFLLALVVSAAAQTAPKGRVALVVDKTVHPGVKDGLERYAAQIQKQFGIACFAMPDDYYKMKPAAIREKLHAEFKKDGAPLVGAIMIGPIPHAIKGDPNDVLVPLPFFYEDFEAKWNDANDDGIYQDAEVVNDRLTNPTEIWTSWWVPPCKADDVAGQVKLLNTFLAKLDRYYKDEITGRDAMLWITGNVGHVETCEGWTVLIKETMNPTAKPLNQLVRIWCRFGQDQGTFTPDKRHEEFMPRDFMAAFTLQPWQFAHIITHGDQRGWFWDAAGVVAANKGPNEPYLLMDFSKFNGTAANIITTSGCSNGNFRGDYNKIYYERFIGSLLLFSPDTNTVAYYGAASPQSTGGEAGFCTEIVEALRADGDSYLAAGYKKMRNMDYAWGTQHYFFRGGDDKVLHGDPFAKFRPSKEPTAEQKKAVEEKIKKAGWDVVGAG